MDVYIWVSTKNRGKSTPQNGWCKIYGKPYEQMDDLVGGFPIIFGNTHMN